MKVIRTKKIAQMFYPFALYNVFPFQEREDAPGTELETITPDDIYEDYLVDTIEEKEGEVPTEVEEEIIEPEEYPEFRTLSQAFQWAKENREVLRIYYITVNGTFIIRDIEPHGDFWARTTLKRILVTWDETIESIRAFRLENVQKYEFKGDQFTPKFNFSPRRKEYKQRIRNRRNRKAHDQWI